MIPLAWSTMQEPTVRVKDDMEPTVRVKDDMLTETTRPTVD
jgi:hypothetical protein